MLGETQDVAWLVKFAKVKLSVKAGRNQLVTTDIE